MRNLITTIFLFFSTSAFSVTNFYNNEGEMGIYVVSSNQHGTPSNISSNNYFPTTTGSHVLFSVGNDHDFDNNGSQGRYIKNTNNEVIYRASHPSEISENIYLSSTIVSTSDNGRFIIVKSNSSYYPENTASKYNMYLWDQLEDKLHLITRTTNDSAIDFNITLSPLGAEVSDDGNYIYFWYKGLDLSRNGTSSDINIYIWDRVSDSRRKINVNEQGEHLQPYTSSLSLKHQRASADGKYFVYHSEYNLDDSIDSSNKISAYLYDRDSNKHRLISRAKQTGLPINSYHSSISSDGNYIVFSSSNDFDPESSSGPSPYHIVLYNNHTFESRYVVLDNEGLALKELKWPTVSNMGKAIAFSSINHALAVSSPRVEQSYYYKTDTNEIFQASISEKNEESSIHRSENVKVLSDASGIIWSHYGGGLKHNENNSSKHRIYMFGYKSDAGPCKLP